MENKQINHLDFRLSLDESLIIKGIAICLMLWHHLFYQHPEYGIFVFQTAKFGKVCVSLFLFVSAYGLTMQYGKIFDKSIAETFKFQAKRFVKFYANYWVIFLFFVPVGIFVFGRNLSIPYGDGSLNQIKMLATDFLGLNSLQSYNITWWFNQLIICLYLLFPFLYFLAKKWSALLLIVSILLWLNLLILPSGVNLYLFVFALGIVYALKIDKINSFLNKWNGWLLLGLLSLTFLVLVIFRQYPFFPHFRGGMFMDGFISLNIIVFVVLTIRHIHTYIQYALKYLGKHSMNIYMIHTFIFAYFFKDFIYSFKYPIVIFVVLTLCSLGISVVIEYLKKIIQLPVLIKNINSKIEKSNI